MSTLPIQYTQTVCQKYIEETYPDLSPTIAYLSSYNANAMITNSKPFTVYIRGTNFTRNGKTTVTFGSYTKLPIIFLSSTSISFTIPMNATIGTYEVKVVNATPIGNVLSNSDVFTVQ